MLEYGLVFYLVREGLKIFKFFFERETTVFFKTLFQSLKKYDQSSYTFSFDDQIAS